MASNSLPGPLCVMQADPFDKGTLCRSQSQLPGPICLETDGARRDPTARAFLFVPTDEVLPSGKLIRKVMVAPDYMTSATFRVRAQSRGLRLLATCARRYCLHRRACPWQQYQSQSVCQHQAGLRPQFRRRAVLHRHSKGQGGRRAPLHNRRDHRGLAAPRA